MRTSCYGLLLTIFALCASVSAQELTPRAYWPTPTGTSVLGMAYQKSTGDIVTDPSLPLTGVDSDIDYLQLSYQRTIDLAGRTAVMQLSLPFSQGETEGLIDNAFIEQNTSGLGDARIRLSYNIKGAPSMDTAEFNALRESPKTIVGVSLLVQAPTGDYHVDQVINIGTNRWSVKPAIGVIWPIRPTWLLEFEAGAWFFGDNNDFVGETREQDPIFSTSFHLVKRIRFGFWASLDANFYVGGETTVNGVELANLQRNSRLGATMLFPLKAKHAIRGSFSTGAVTDSGGDYEMLSLGYFYVW